MQRSEYVLIGLAPAQRRPHTPVQVQKLFSFCRRKGRPRLH